MRQKSMQIFLIFSGWFCIILGVIGIFLPVLPTTPFILLAAFCFSRSSPKFHNWMLSHRFFGPIVRNYEAGKGLPRKIRFRGVMLMWLGMIGSMIIVRKLWGVALLCAIGISVTIYIYRLPVYDEDSPTT